MTKSIRGAINLNAMKDTAACSGGEKGPVEMAYLEARLNDLLSYYNSLISNRKALSQTSLLNCVEKREREREKGGGRELILNRLVSFRRWLFFSFLLKGTRIHRLGNQTQGW